MVLARVGGAAVTVGVMVTACGGSAPVVQGKDSMLREAGVATACEEAARDHLQPFVVEWDATELSDFEARAAMNTIFVKYEGCDIEVLYGCQNADERGAFGAYGRPQFTSGSYQGFDVETENELFAKLPLSAVSLGGRVKAGESLSLKYFVSGVATNTRDQIAREEITSQPACQGATHFVWAYNLGAFELGTAESTEADATVGVGDIGGGVKGSTSKSSLGRGGDLDSCETQDQRACRTPIRLTLRPIGDGPAKVPAAGPDGGVASPPSGSTEESAKLALAAAKEKAEARDGKACLEKIVQAIGYVPQLNVKPGVQLLRAECLMLSGQCDEGKSAYRETMASNDVKREMSDALLDKETRERSNELCPSSTADNDADRVMRLAYELRAARKAGDADLCKQRFAEFRPVFKRLLKAPRDGMNPESRAAEFGSNAYTEASACFAAANQCEASKNAYLGQYADAGTPGIDPATMVPIWKNVLKASKIENCQ